MAKMKIYNGYRNIFLIPIILLVVLAMFIGISFAAFKAVKNFGSIVGGYFPGNTYTVSFDDGNCDSLSVKLGKEYGELCEPTAPSGYVFDGWNGKNLLNPVELTSVAIDFGINVDENGYISDSTPTTDSRIWEYSNSNWLLSLNAGTYNISLDFGQNPTSESYATLMVYKSDNTSIVSKDITNVTNISSTFTLSETTAIGIFIKSYDGIYRIQLEEGSTATPYEPYYVDSSTIVTRTGDHTLIANYAPASVITYNYNGKKNYLDQTSYAQNNYSNASNYTTKIGDFITDNLNINDKLLFKTTYLYSNLTYDDTNSYRMIYQFKGFQTGWYPGFQLSPFYPSDRVTAFQESTAIKDASSLAGFESNDGFLTYIRSDYYTSGVFAFNDFSITRVTEVNTPKRIGSNIGTLPVISEDEYYFDGWYTAASEGTQITANTVVPATDTTYYAHWKAKPTVDFRTETVNGEDYIALDVYSPDVTVTDVVSNESLVETDMTKNLKIYVMCVTEAWCDTVTTALTAAGYTDYTTIINEFPDLNTLVDGNYNAFIGMMYYGGVNNTVADTFFENGIDMITMGNDTRLLSIINTYTSTASTTRSIFTRRKNNNFTRKIGIGGTDADARQSITFKPGVEVMYDEYLDDAKYDSMGYYNENGTKWFHLQSRLGNGSEVKFITSSADYIASKNVYYFKVEEAGTYTFDITDSSGNTNTYTYEYN